MKQMDCLIVGGGLMGSAAAWQLALSGRKVLLIEQQSEQYSFGSSFGEGRVTRSLGPQDDIYRWLKEFSVEETKKLTDFLGSSMDEIYRTSPVTYLYDEAQKDEVDRLVMDADYVLATTSDEASDKLAMTVKDEIVIREFKPYSGTLNPKVLINMLHAGIRKKGGTVLYEHETKQIEREGEVYRIVLRVKNKNEEYPITCKKLVVAAGPYNPSLLQKIAPYFEDLITLRRLFLAFFEPDPQAWRKLTDKEKDTVKQGFPVAKFDDQVFYALIENYKEDGIPLFKVGGHNRRFPIKCDLWGEMMPATEINWSRSQLTAYLRRLNVRLSEEQLSCTDTYACVYSMTKTEVPLVCHPVLLDQSPDTNCVVLAGLSGIGAKGSLAYGKIAADLINGTEENDVMYIKTRDMMGHERVRYDLLELGLI